MKTLFLGDSLTQGMPGVSYWRFLSNKKNLINKGLGGDTLRGATKRAEKILKQAKYADVDRFIIEIGVNDVLLPYLRTRFSLWRFTVWLKGNVLGCVPTTDITAFRREYEDLLQRLRTENKKIGVIGLPLIENSKLPLNDTVILYNAVIVELCKKYELPYVDLNALEEKIKGDNVGSYFFGKTNLGNVIDAVFTSFLPFSMTVAKARGLAVTVDSVHLNKKMAKVLAAAVDKQLL